jgi:hypothetical protein
VKAKGRNRSRETKLVKNPLDPILLDPNGVDIVARKVENEINKES